MAMNDPVSNAERQLIAIACRLDTALRYRDEHGADDDWIRQGIDDEMIGINEIFEAAGNTVPRLHALLRMIGERSECAQDLKETLNLDDFSINEIKKFCAFTRKENPQWHPLLTMSNVRDLVSQLPPAVEWWLPGEPTMEDKEAAEDAAAEANAGEEDGDGDNNDEIQITESPDTAGTVQPRCSGHNTKGKAPAHADDDSGTVDTLDGGDDIEMCEIIDNQKTPKKFQPVKCAIVISPASEVPAKRQQRRTSAAAKAAAKAIGHLPNPVCISHGVSECLPQTDAPKAHVCQMCKIRKVPCNPPPKWVIPQIEAKQQAAKVKQDNKNCKRSAASLVGCGNPKWSIEQTIPIQCDEGVEIRGDILIQEDTSPLPTKGTWDELTGIPGLRGYAGDDSLPREESPRDKKAEKMVVLKKTKMAILVFHFDYSYSYARAFKRHFKLS
ncbi:hypothetical protein EDB86DRAFT_2834414 [Lactarius hatsudake]|nr:hypothetical protein EDB86DRAFT_2834414 [Lactarius hatsudake]